MNEPKITPSFKKRNMSIGVPPKPAKRRKTKLELHNERERMLRFEKIDDRLRQIRDETLRRD